MRAAIIDASPIVGGPVTRALDHALAEMGCEPADVLRVRVSDLFALCAQCSSCRSSGRCTRRSGALDARAAELARADVLLMGLAGHLHARDPRCRALLHRLVGGFAHVSTRRGSAGARPRASRARHAAFVVSAPPLLGAVAMLGMLPTGLAGAWDILDAAGVQIVGSTSVSTGWWRPGSIDATSERARRLGRRVAARRAQLPVLAPVPAPGPALVTPPLVAARSA